MSPAIDWERLKLQTESCRKLIVGLLADEEPRSRTIPATWRNHLYWHAGHLVVTPHLLSRGLAGQPIDLPEEYRTWFAKGTSPETWTTEPSIPYADLVSQIVDSPAGLFDTLAGEEATTPFPNPYETSMGIVLSNPLEALHFSGVHDGIHLGLVLALKRALDGLDAAGTAS